MIVQNSQAPAHARRGAPARRSLGDRLMAHMDDATREALDQGPWTTLAIALPPQGPRVTVTGW